MRLMSFSLTTDQVRRRIKRVTRRIGWDFLRPAMMVQPIEKGMGLKAGEAIVRVGSPILIVSTRWEPLTRLIDEPRYGSVEAELEGFPGWSGEQFVEFICRQPGVYPERELNRIEFSYTD